MKEKDNIRLVEVFAGEHWQATMIKSILEDSGIDVSLENELMGTIAPWRVTAGGFNPVKVIVSNLNCDLSLQLIKEFNDSENIPEAGGEELQP